MVFFFSASKTLSLPTPAFLTRTTRHHPHVTQSASSQSNASSSNDSTIRVATGFTTRDEENVLEDHHRTSTNATATTTTGRRRSRRSAVLTMMSPIQLQDVARKQFEDRERRRAQQVRRRSVAKGIRLSIFFQKSFLPPVVKKERVFIGGSFLRILLLRLYFDATRFCLSPHTTPLGGRPAASCLLYTSPSPRDAHESRMPSSA